MPSVLQSGYNNLQIIVADNASSDDSVAFLKKEFPQVNIIQLKENYGFAKGYNEALKQVEADYYMLLNSDVEVTPGWLNPMVALLENNKGIAACQPKLRAFHNRSQFEYAGAAGGWIDQFGYPFARGRVFDLAEEDSGQYDTTEPVFWATGAALFIRAELYHQLGGFDEYFFAHQEEIDLCWRLQLAGYKIYCCPSSVVYHVGGGTLPKGNSRKTFLNFRNNMIMLYKNLPWREKWWKIPFRQLLNAASAWKALLSGDTGFFKAVIRADIGFAGWLFFHQKKSVFPKVKNGKPEGVFRGNLVWEHFIKKRKKFSGIVKKRVQDI